MIGAFSPASSALPTTGQSNPLSCHSSNVVSFANSSERIPSTCESVTLQPTMNRSLSCSTTARPRVSSIGPTRHSSPHSSRSNYCYWQIHLASELSGHCRSHLSKQRLQNRKCQCSLRSGRSRHFSPTRRIVMHHHSERCILRPILERHLSIQST